LFGDTIHALVAPGADADLAWADLSAAGLTVLDVEEIEPSLEDVFIHLVGEAARV
jgi:hypothetical protein